MSIRLRLFGPFELAPVREPLSRKGGWVLALLALRRGDEVERSWLAGTLWPDTSEAQARYDLRREVARLRRTLGPDEGWRLRATRGSLALDLSGADVDLVAFDEAVRAGDPRALEHQRGPLLADCAEAWVLEAREACRRAFVAAAMDLAARSDPETAAGYLRRAVAADPLDEGVRRALMRALAAAGSHAGALATYRELRVQLERDLQVDPAPETRALQREIQTAAQRPLARPTAPVRSRGGAVPRPLGRLVGRRAEAEAVAARLRADRLVTLTGSGGVGKSRLAVEVASDLAGAFADGVVFVEVGRLADPALLDAAVTEAIGVPEAPGRPLDELLAAAVADRELLLVLDDCDHLLAAAAPLAAGLLRAGAQLRILATSRQSLGLPGEVVWRVPSLAEADAVALFEERALQAGGAPGEPEVVARICRRLDGIPLAIELAAARTRALSVAEIAARLDDCFRLLGSGGRGALPRHRTLDATIDWSYRLLDPDEQAALGTLSVFAGGGALDDVEAVHGGPAVDALDRLVDRSLVGFAGGRYRLLETVRAYARARLGGREAELRGRHLARFLALAEEAEPHVMCSGDDAWLGRLDAEADNLRAAFDHARTDATNADAVLRLGSALWWFWFDRGRIREAQAASAAIVPLCPRASPAAAARALTTAGFVEHSSRDTARSAALFAEGLEVARRAGDPRLIAFALGGVALSRVFAGDVPAASRLVEEAESVSRASGDAGVLLFTLGLAAPVASMRGDRARARALLEEAEEVARARGLRVLLGHTLIALGQDAQARGDRRAARACLMEAFRTFRPHETCGRSRIVASLGWLAFADGEARTGAELLGAADRIYDDVGVSMFIPERPDYARARELARHALGGDDFARAWADGRSRGAERVIAESRSLAVVAGGAEPLTARSSRALAGT